MKKQQYKNHKKYYFPHHFIFLPMMAFLTGLGIRNAFHDPLHQLEWLLFGIVSFCIFYLAVMLRQHYALGNQDRIVRLEFRLRYFELFGKRSEQVEEKLSFSQIAALRFAGDHEFAGLLEQALDKNMSADEIKRSIQQWKPDNMRL
jgi:hypothetical protein